MINEDKEAVFIPSTTYNFHEFSPEVKGHANSILESIYWQTFGWVHSPPFTNIDLIPNTISVPGSTLKSESYQLYFKKSFNPKVQVEDKVPYGVLPRSIVVEIEKRKFAKQNLKQILQEVGLETDILKPLEVNSNKTTLTLNIGNLEKIPTKPFLPLHLFDDDWFYETRLPSEWLLMGQSQGECRPVPATALLPTDSKADCDNFDWQKVSVMNYDTEKKLYCVRRETDCERNGFTLLSLNEDLDFWIHRIYLKFEAEETKQFVKRLCNAVATRHIVEETIRLNFFVEHMPVENITDWPKKDVNKIISIARKNRYLQSQFRWIKEKVNEIIEELNYEYKKTCNYITYCNISEQNLNLMKEFQNENLLYFQNVQVIKLKHLFTENFKNFQYSTLWTQVEVIQALHSAQTAILNLYEKSLYCLPVDKILTLDAFESIQKNQLQTIEEYIHGPWLDEIEKSIVTNLKQCGIGSYDLNQNYFHTFQLTKLGKLLKMINFKMQDVVRFLINNSLYKYSEVILNACENLVNVNIGFKWSESFYSDIWAASSPPIFEVPLEIKENHLEFVVDLKQYLYVVVQLFNNGLHVAKNLPRIEKLVMKKLLHNPLDKLDTVQAWEEEICIWKKAIVTGMDKAIIVATSYIKTYDCNLAGFKEDQINYVKRLDRSKVSGAELKLIIETHYKEKDKLLDDIPDFIDIGPFRLLTETVRTTAVKKHELLADAVLSYFYDKLRQDMEKINDQFLILIDKIEQKTGNIEDLLQKKIWCRTVPKKIERLSLDVNNLRQDCELIASFNRNLTDGDFKTYWKIQALPQKTMNKLDRRMMEFDAERELHKVNLESDHIKLKTDLKNLEWDIEVLRNFSDAEKVSSVAADVRKARKKLASCAQQVELLNGREKLFGQTIKEYPEVQELSERLAPSELLWLNFAEFQKYRERELEKQLTIELEHLYKVIVDFRSNIVKSLDFFSPDTSPEVHDAAVFSIKEIDEFLNSKFKNQL